MNGLNNLESRQEFMTTWSFFSGLSQREDKLDGNKYEGNPIYRILTELTLWTSVERSYTFTKPFFTSRDYNSPDDFLLTV